MGTVPNFAAFAKLGHCPIFAARDFLPKVGPMGLVRTLGCLMEPATSDTESLLKLRRSRSQRQHLRESGLLAIYQHSWQQLRPVSNEYR